MAHLTFEESIYFLFYCFLYERLSYFDGPVLVSFLWTFCSLVAWILYHRAYEAFKPSNTITPLARDGNESYHVKVRNSENSLNLNMTYLIIVSG